MRRAPRLDGNHAEIVEALHRAGIQVRSMAEVGKGFPDLLVAFRGVLCLLEVKDGRLPPSERQPTKAELGFISTWPRTYVVTSAEEAVRVVIEAARPPGAPPMAE